MVNTDLVLELYKIYASEPENFPRILNALIRRELLNLARSALEEIELIEGEASTSRGRYLGEHLEDLANAIQTVEQFLEYFRDVPLGKDSSGSITTSEDLRLKLRDNREWLMSIRENVRRDNWKEVSDEEFEEVKENAHVAALDTRTKIEELDKGLALSWTEPEPQPDYVLE